MTDVRPDSRGGWTWEPDKQWPALQAVLKAPLWADERYDGYRQMLLQPLPVPTLDEGGSFLTLKVGGGDHSEAAPMSEVWIGKLVLSMITTM